jgi:cyanophycinase
MKSIFMKQISLSMLMVLNACSEDSLNQLDKNYVDLFSEKKEINVQYAKAPTEPVSYLTGSAADVTTSTSAGLVLMGGSTDVDAAIAWLLTRSGGGDVVVIRASGADGYNTYMYNMVPVNSVETIIIDSRLKAELPSVSLRIQNAEALFIAGGDQWNYVNYWKNTATETAINYLINTKKVPVGGTSAGLAILGQAYYSAEKGSVTSAQALNNPFHRYVTLGHSDFVNAPYLQNLITDSHYTQRDRQGRHITFMARLMNTMGFANIKGLGIDEQTAVCIDQNGLAKVYGINNAYFLSNSLLGAETCTSGIPLTWNRSGQAIKAYKITGSGTGNGSVDMTNWNNASGGNSYFYYVVNGVLF